MHAGTRVLVDGKRLATVLEAFPEGSTSFAFPYVRVRTDDGEPNLVVALGRVRPLGPRGNAPEGL